MNVNTGPIYNNVLPGSTTLSARSPVESPLGLETLSAKTDILPPVDALSSTAKPFSRGLSYPLVLYNASGRLQEPGAAELAGLEEPSAEEQLGLQDPGTEQQPGPEAQARVGDSTSSASDQREAQARAEQRVEQIRLDREQAQIRKLAARDREVRAHEQAHSSVGGEFAGAIRYTTVRGPNGVSYAVGGEVPIRLGAVAGDPRQTLQNAQQIQRAALAPADPSPADRRIAARAVQIAIQARQELSRLVAEEAAVRDQERAGRTAEADNVDNGDGAAESDTSASNEADSQRVTAQTPESADTERGQPQAQNVERRFAVGSSQDTANQLGGVVNQRA